MGGYVSMLYAFVMFSLQASCSLQASYSLVAVTAEKQRRLAGFGRWVLNLAPEERQDIEVAWERAVKVNRLERYVLFDGATIAGGVLFALGYYAYPGLATSTRLAGGCGGAMIAARGWQCLHSEHQELLRGIAVSRYMESVQRSRQPGSPRLEDSTTQRTP